MRHAIFTAALAAVLASPCVFAQALPATEEPAIACDEIQAALERAEQARRQAQDANDTAWKAVVPFVVLARKAGAHAALDEADRQLALLKARRQACFPFS